MKFRYRTIRNQFIGVLAAATLTGSCVAEDPLADGDSRVDSVEDAVEASYGSSRLDRVLRKWLKREGVKPAQAPAAQEPALVELGRNLFFDRELSGRRNISCATCHNPILGSADGQSQSRGQGAIGLGPERRQDGDAFFEFLPRNALSLWNRGVPAWDVMFWDGRLGGNTEEGFFSPAGADTPQDVANALALFSVIPITPAQEMRGFPGQRDIFGNETELEGLTDADFPQIWELITARIVNSPGYDRLLASAFPGIASTDVTISNLVNALGAFQSEAFTALNSPFDRYLAGDNSALSASAKRGALLFYGRANCSNCHSGSLQTDFEFHNIAAPQVGTGRPGFEPLDLGRAETTGLPQDRFKFRTPSLRNIELEGPWFHNGAYADLEDAVRHHLYPEASLKNYDDSQVEPELVGTFVDDPAIINELLETIDPKLGVTGRRLRDAEIQDLMAFLSALTDPASINLFDLIPDSVPSGLPLNH
ncbi:MAG: cytochrome-c peroxidase [Proteobacteria bacterium]|nr:cytochrome-c peroxidase [Pseudomonadota bacterium]